MFLSDRQAKWLRVGTTVLFGVTFVAAFFFTSGYRFDSSSQQIVKKSVILFDSTVKHYRLSLNGVEEQGIDHELRLVPGVYNISLSAPDSHEWKKTVMLTDDDLVRLGNAWLIPNSIGEVTPSRMPQLDGLKILSQSGNVLGYKVAGGSLLVVLGGSNPITFESLSFKGVPATFSAAKFAYADSIKKLFILDTKNQIWQFDTDKKALLEKKIAAKDVVSSTDFIGYLSPEGKLVSLADTQTSLDDFELEAPYQLDRIDSVAKEGSLFVVAALAHTKEDATVKLVLVVDGSGNLIFADAGNAPHSVDRLITYVHSDELHVFDPQLEEAKVILKNPNLTEVASMQQLGKTFWRLIETTSHHLHICDAWMENCMSLGMTDSPLAVKEKNGYLWKAFYQGTQVTYDFDPQNTHEKTIPDIFSDFIQSNESSSLSSTSVEASESIQTKPK